MHIITATRTLDFAGTSMEEGRTYWVEDTNVAELLAMEACVVERHLTTRDADLYSFDPSEDWNGKRIYFMRPGGYGDLLFLTPIFREIKRRWPGAKINVVCFPRYFDAISKHESEPSFVPYPLDSTHLRPPYGIVFLENLIERSAEAKETHVVDLIAQHMGLELEDKHIAYFPTFDELRSALYRYPRRHSRKRIGVQVYASSPVRTYPHQQMTKLVQLLLKEYEVFLFGAPGQIRGTPGPNLVNLTQRETPVSFCESAAILHTCDAVIAPDSALCHVAGAMNIPTVALYGPFPWQLRTKYASSVTGINGHAPCAPCFHHSRHSFVFPEGGPCQKTGNCIALGNIEPERIIAKLKQKIS